MGYNKAALFYLKCLATTKHNNNTSSSFLPRCTISANSINCPFQGTKRVCYGICWITQGNLGSKGGNLSVAGLWHCLAMGEGSYLHNLKRKRKQEECEECEEVIAPETSAGSQRGDTH